MPSNETFITAAYVLTWVTLVGYVVYLVRRASRARAAFVRLTGVPEGETQT